MAWHTISNPALVINSGTTTSNAIANVDDAAAYGIFSPATLTGTITVEVEPTSTGTSFVALESGGVTVTIGASRAIVINPTPFRQLRLASNASEAATRTFSVLRTMPI